MFLSENTQRIGTRPYDRNLTAGFWIRAKLVIGTSRLHQSILLEYNAYLTNIVHFLE